MRDAAAEVLLNRQAMRQPRALGVVASLILHATIAVGFLASTGHAMRGEIRRPVVVKLTPFAGPDDRAPGTRTSPAASPVSPAAEQKPAPPIVEEKPKKDLPTRAEATKETVRESLFGQDPKKVEGERGKESARPAAPIDSGRESDESAAGIGFPAVGSAGVTGLEGGDFPYTIYIQRMLALIGKNWFRPDTPGEPLSQVYFVIERDGSIRDAEIEVRSGSAIFDRAALRSIIESSPLPPLPFGYQGTYLGVHLTFH